MGAALNRILPVTALLLSVLSPAFAQSTGPGADKASDGSFTGLLLVTDNVDWYGMFQQPEPPEFSAKAHFGPRERGSLAILFSNAEPRNGVVRVVCDITAHDPVATRQIASDQVCYEGPFLGPNVLHPTNLDLQFEMGANEPAGEGGFAVSLRDAYSGRAVDLAVSFTQGNGP